MQTAAANSLGTVVQVIGPVLDIDFSASDDLPKIYDALQMEYELEGEAKHLRDVWIAVRGTLREVLEHVTLGQVLRGELPEAVTRFTSDPDTWVTRVI